MLKRFIVNEVSDPLQLISKQLNQIRLDEQLDWQRSAHAILEVDEIDQAIHQNMQQFKHVIDKLDAVKVTEHETGFFLASHFSEALKFEIYRCQRYQHEFSIITLKLHSVRDLDKTQKRSMPKKMLTFSNLIQSHIRRSDMPFRISENLFLVIAPEMSDVTAQEFQRSLIERFSDTKLNEEMKLIFEVSVGFASYPMDAIDSKGLTRIALERMTRGPATLLSKEAFQNLAAEPITSDTQAETSLT